MRMFGSFTLSIGVIGALLAACGGTQSPLDTGLRSFGHFRQQSGSYGYCPSLVGGTGVLPDGDFSQALNPGPNGPVYNKGQAFAPEWEVDKGNVNFDGTGVWSGGLRDYCSVELDGYIPGGIKTNAFATTRGKSYTLSFAFSGNCGGPPAVKKMKVSVDEQSTQYTWDTSGGNCASAGDYQSEVWTFKATKRVAAFIFTSLDPHCCSYGPIVEQVYVTENQTSSE